MLDNLYVLLLISAAIFLSTILSAWKNYPEHMPFGLTSHGNVILGIIGGLIGG